ncbi:hybrid sensor histidine kinase/response regulator [Brunnivagina elsteri]|uniref:histidine kinase n=1 Tax=Brunnivagina elsteri CCALA 953 TaxID=987040 RepID=A0A2A2TFZ3_9CYAN|nr:ATP-binding protein [Calothrix elsteri]PAX52611.1 hybrid sensor histidine kinase/response regulator [Calothrix elsteri CCALA 953]
MVKEFWISFFSSESFIPHGHCYLWQNNLVWLHILSDSLIALSYYSIPITLFYFVRKRRDLPFNWIFLLFAGFIIACGTTHIMEVWTLWHPVYWVSGSLKAITAMISVITAIELFPLVPQALALPSPAQLEQVNQALQGQIAEKLKAEEKLRTYQNHLEELVAARTNELTEANEKLQQEIAERKRTEIALRQSEEQFRQLTENIDEIYWLTSPDATQVLYVSPAYDLIAGCSREILYQRSDAWFELIHPDDRSQVLTAVRERVRNETGLNAEYRIVRPDGEIRWVKTKEYPICDEFGKIFRIAGVAEDITEHKEIEAERERLLVQEKAARAQAEEANQIKDQFLAVLSHELRSPLNPILGWSKILLTRKLEPEKTIEALTIIERNAKLQAQLIEDLLDISRILQGKFSLNIQSVYLESIIYNALETIRLAAEAKSIDLIFTINNSELKRLDRQSENPIPNPKFKVMGDSTRLQQIIWNILSNAIKFTPVGGRVEVRLEKINNYAQITVDDTGKGISSEFLPYVFEYFRQADSATTRKFGGLGLGLAIAKQLVELHGGAITVDSPGEEQGSTFTLQLPLLEVHGGKKMQENWNEIDPNLRNLEGIKILVVDDDKDSRDFIVFVLEQEGAIVTPATSAFTALEVLTKFTPDVMVSDIAMPEMDGYALMRQVKTSLVQPKAIALTAYAGEYDQKQALTAGFLLHISKPVEPDKLVAAITQILRCDR